MDNENTNYIDSEMNILSDIANDMVFDKKIKLSKGDNTAS